MAKAPWEKRMTRRYFLVQGRAIRTRMAMGRR